MKIPSILEGGIARNFNAKRLYVRPSSGDTLIPFVPEDDVGLTTKSITKNGAYTASKDGVYGWSSVTVNVPSNSSVTGKGDDGKQHTITTDDDGYLDDIVTPESIAVTTLPATVQYTDGQTIVYTGIVVHAYDSDGEDLGEVPFNELVFPVTVAEYDPSMGEDVDWISADIDTSPVGQPIPASSSISGEATWSHFMLPESVIYTNSAEFNSTGTKMVIYSVGGGQYVVLSASASADAMTTVHMVKGYNQTESTTSYQGMEYTLNGRTFYMVSIAGYFFGPYDRNDTNVDPISVSGAMLNGGEDIQISGEQSINIGYALVFGSVVGHGAGMTIPVEWARTGDGAVLSTDFGIVVAEAGFGGASGGGGNTSGGGVGRI